MTEIHMSRNFVGPHNHHTYLVGGNQSPVFAFGRPGASDDFFLVGLEPEESAAMYPLLTGNFFDSNGNRLFQLTRNQLTVNPAHCSKIVSDRIGYSITDDEGATILRVSTLFQGEPGDPGSSFVTTITGNFYDRNGELVVSSDDKGGGKILSSVPTMLGLGGIVVDMSDVDMQFLEASQQTAGAINEVLTGQIHNQNINLEGKALIGAHLVDCVVNISQGNFLLLDYQFERVELRATGPASMLFHLFQKLSGDQDRQ